MTTLTIHTADSGFYTPTSGALGKSFFLMFSNVTTAMRLIEEIDQSSFSLSTLLLKSSETEKSEPTTQAKRLSALLDVEDFGSVDLDSLLQQIDPSVLEEGARMAHSSAAAHLAAVDGGESIRSMRMAAGLSQAQLAALIGHDQPYISKLERGTCHNIETRTLEKLRDALNVSADAILDALKRAREKTSTQE